MRHLLIVCAAASLLHLGIFFGASVILETHGGSIWTFVGDKDSNEYVTLARSMAEEHRFVLTDDIPDTFRTPGYPAFLLALFAFTGESLLVVALSSILFVGCTAAMIVYIGESQLGLSRKFAIVVAFLFSIGSGAILATATGLGNDIFYTALYLFVTCVLVTTTSSNKKITLWAIVAGVLFAMLAYTRPVGIFAALPLAAGMFFIPPISLAPTILRRIQLTAISLAVFALCLSPWLYRNYVATGVATFSTLPTYNFVYYNIPFFVSYQKGISEKAARAEVLGGLEKAPTNELRNYPYALELKAIRNEFIRTYSVPYAGFHTLKTIPFFVGSGFNVMYASMAGEAPQLKLSIFPSETYNLTSAVLSGEWGRIIEVLKTYWVVTLERLVWLSMFILAFISPFFARGVRQRILILFICIILANAFLTSPVSQPRYRIPVEPFIWLAAAYTVHALWRWRSQQDFRFKTLIKNPD